MSHYGNIKSYDSNKGSGTIEPENGGDALPFKKADLQQEGQEPKISARYSYETEQVNNGQKMAKNLKQQGQGQQSQGQQGSGKQGGGQKDQARKQQG